MHITNTELILKIVDDAKKDGKDVNQTILAEKAMGTVRSNFTNKIVRNSFMLKDVINIADYLGMKVYIEGNGHKYVLKKED